MKRHHWSEKELIDEFYQLRQEVEEIFSPPNGGDGLYLTACEE